MNNDILRGFVESGLNDNLMLAMLEFRNARNVAGCKKFLMKQKEIQSGDSKKSVFLECRADSDSYYYVLLFALSLLLKLCLFLKSFVVCFIHTQIQFFRKNFFLNQKISYKS